MITSFEKQKPVEVLEGHVGRFLQSDRMTFVLWDIREGAAIPSHSHENEQVVQILDGEYILTVSGADYYLRSGDFLVIKSGLEHSGRAVTRCRILDTFCPVRDDYRSYVS